jgi:hypothetical protein
MTSRSLTTLPVALLACVPGAPAGAEQERVDGMARTRGWVVATDGGDLSFVDCQAALTARQCPHRTVHKAATRIMRP